MWQKVLLIALLGAVGTLARYYLSGTIEKFTGEGFPWGTLCVNVLGCFLFGTIWTLSDQYLSTTSKTIILTGFMGAFTTFSTFAFQCAEMTKDGNYFLGFANLSSQVILGLLFVFLGMSLGRIF